jgi:RNA polymerase sigma-70 factor, ECF subfamily
MIFEKKRSAKELFQTYSGDVFNYSLSILKDYDDAKDAVQEVFIRFIKSEETFRGECSYKTWLLTITRNYCYRKSEGKSNQLQKIDGALPNAYEMNIDSSISLNDALAELSKDEYEIFYLREYAGYSYLEIAEILKISVDNVKVKLYRVRQRLRKYLK